MNDGKMEYVKFSKAGLNNLVSLSHNNILQKAHKWARFSYGKTLGCYSCRYSVPHVQVWAILPESNMDDPIEVRWNGCETGGVHLEKHDEPT